MFLLVENCTANKSFTFIHFVVTIFDAVELCSNGHIFVDLSSIRHRDSTWKVRRDFTNFEKRIYVETITSIRRGNFDVDLTFKIDKILMSFPRGFFYVVSTSNQCNFCTRCFHSIIS